MYGALKSAKYSKSGDSLGNLYTVEAFRSEDGGVVVKVRESAQHNLPIDVGEYRADDDLLDRVSDIIDRVGMKEWGELPLSEFIAYDAPTTSIHLEFESADPKYEWPLWLDYSFDNELPEGGEDAIREIYNLMRSYVSDANQIATYVDQVE